MENLALISPKFPIAIGSLNQRRLSQRRAVSSELGVPAKFEMQSFASISSSTINSTPPSHVSYPISYIGSPMLWIGVGVGLSALFSVVATKLKRQAILHAFKTVMGPDSSQNGEFNTDAFSPGSPFPFHASSTSPPITSFQTPVVPEKSVRGDDPATKVEALPPADVKSKTEQVKDVSNESNTLHSKETPTDS
ncbi:protein TIC 40, chloroplastic-like isoform X2 [Asparagus officinalis]|uniref:protein TIC 40, chloroplastic-like isoform X2 n=1 Tax=Asparagus officinalis TaxID=4686 RepID=UPI00098DF3E1|nr:protein TIC 40, chloroplastic-like isoform X2 [Asparagus officinalis]